MKRLNAHAARLGISRSEVIRRLVANEPLAKQRTRAALLKEMQAEAGLTPARAARWTKAIDKERRAWQPRAR